MVGSCIFPVHFPHFGVSGDVLLPYISIPASGEQRAQSKQWVMENEVDMEPPITCLHVQKQLKLQEGGSLKEAE